MKPGEPRLIADIAWALVHGLMMRVLDRQFPLEQAHGLVAAGRRSLIQKLAIP